MGELGRSLVRIGSFTGKELREVIRRPGVLASLILGPFLIMFLFGLGYTGYRTPFATEVVIPENSDLPRDLEYYAELAPGRLDVRGVGTDAEAAEGRLRAGKIDLLIVTPENAASELRSGRQTTIRVAWNEVDPVYNQLAILATEILVSSLNAEIIEAAAAEGIAFAEGELGPAVTDIPPEVIARPTTAETANVAPSEPNVINFFGPAVFALVLQHLAITLTALSMVRERLSGQMDRFRVAPVTSMEVLTGKYVAYAALSLGVAGIVGLLLVRVLGVPLLGGWPAFVGIVLLLAFASLGVGLLISLVADS
jgi:ABC-2 type transport system permease protein